MIRVVLDTNILVSSLWTLDGNAAHVVKLFVEKAIIVFYSQDILNEYKEVLNRPLFGFQHSRIGGLINSIKRQGLPVEVSPSGFPINDESDRKFYDIARGFNAILITGNLKHYPARPFIMTASDFLFKYYN